MGGFVAAVSVQQFIATGAYPPPRHPGAEVGRWLVPSIAGTKVGAIAISEPDAGSDVAAIRTAARCDGDCWVIDGAKPGSRTAWKGISSSSPAGPTGTRARAASASSWSRCRCAGVLAVEAPENGLALVRHG